MEYYDEYLIEINKKNRAEAEIRSLKRYIFLLEAERDYYQSASEFAGVPNTPRPQEMCLVEE